LPSAPLQVTFSSSLPYFGSDPGSYDSWSIGVLFLELLLGTPHVFTVDQRTRAILAHKLRRQPESDRRQVPL
jgi:serine/threonine protein kinase